jgi:hypothetical protein
MPDLSLNSLERRAPRRKRSPEKCGIVAAKRSRRARLDLRDLPLGSTRPLSNVAGRSRHLEIPIPCFA